MSTFANEAGGFGGFSSASGAGTSQQEAPWARRVNVGQGDDAERRRRRLIFLATLMDSAITVPGTNYKFGLDPILGLAPGIGDVITDAISLYIVYEGYKLGATKKQIAMMLGNVAIDTLVGAVPVLGDLFDFAFKANVRNLAILGIKVGAAART